jgi:hypothetical protein
MATKATYIVVLAVSCLSVLCAAYLHTKDKSRAERKKALARAALYAAAICTAVVLAVGWFYYFRNHQTSGSWFRASPAEYSHGREYKSLEQVVTSGKLWQLFYGEYAEDALLSTVMSSLALAGFLGVTRLQVGRIFQRSALRMLAGLFFLAVLGMLVVQVAFAVGFGAINFRYMLPVLLPLAFFLAYGLLEFTWTRGQFVTLAVFMMGAATLLPVASSSTMLRLVPELAQSGLGLRRIFVATSHNGVPPLMTLLLLLAFAGGVVLLSGTLYKLSGLVDKTID